jgi:ribosomal protein S6
MRKYEGMFLFDPSVLTDWESIQAELTRLFERAEARVIACGKWDERRLAYEIRGVRRGVYALTYFETDASKVVGLERDAGLSEGILRCLVVRVDHLTEDEMKEIAAQPAPHGPPEGNGDDYPRRGGRRDGGGYQDRRDRHDRGDRGERHERRERHERGERGDRPRKATSAGRPDDENSGGGQDGGETSEDS